MAEISFQAPRYGVSADVAGGFGDIEEVIRLYEDKLYLKFDRIELFAVRGTMRQNIRKVLEADKSITFHGRTGGTGLNTIDTYKLWFIEQGMHSTQHLVEHYLSTYNILVHTPELQCNGALQALLHDAAALHPMQDIIIENHPGEDLQEMIGVVQGLRAQGIPAQGCVDFGHSAFGTALQAGKPFDNAAFEEVLCTVEQATKLTTSFDGENRTVIEYAHLPIGETLDSLPILDISPSGLKWLGEILQQFSTIILENLSKKSRNQIRRPKCQYPAELKRLDPIIDALHRYGLYRAN